MGERQRQWEIVFPVGGDRKEKDRQTERVRVLKHPDILEV